MGKIIAFDHTVGDLVYVKSRDLKGVIYNIYYEFGCNGNNDEAFNKPMIDMTTYYIKTTDGRYGKFDANAVWFPEFTDKLQWKKDKAILKLLIDACLDNGNKELFNTYTNELVELERKEKEVETKTT